MPRPGISELSAFVAIAQHRSFSAAARAMGVTPSALSHAMRALEARLQTRLFTRTTRSMALTDAGELLLRRVAPAIRDLEEAVDEVTSAQQRPSGSIRINCSENGARPLIEHVLPNFLETYPDIDVEFVSDTRLVDIVAGGFDAGIRVLEDVPKDMIAVRFGPEMRFAAVASPTYIGRHGMPQNPNDLLSHRCIRFRFESGALFRWDLEHLGRRVSLDVDGPMTLGNLNLMVWAALAGIGIAWVPESLVSELVTAGLLIHVLPGLGPSFGEWCLYYPANRHTPPALHLFANAVREWSARQRLADH
ncbi:MAG: LysR family transcriptional regulator [Paraburkholderia sp.]|uniref:LysR family transcriptional regulator n=1 Tax=Paraburkholderia sp. TaxID=1926495 RepID=UPI003C519685